MLSVLIDVRDVMLTMNVLNVKISLRLNMDFVWSQTVLISVSRPIHRIDLFVCNVIMDIH